MKYLQKNKSENVQFRQEENARLINIVKLHKKRTKMACQMTNKPTQSINVNNVHKKYTKSVDQLVNVW